jgi:hypothetical protein
MTSKPLTGCVVGISISESEEMERLGFDRREMNRCVVRLSELLLAAGARLAFGHDWRPGGVMEAVAALAVRYFRVRRDAEGRPLSKAPIINRVEWMRQPFLAEVQRRDPGVSELSAAQSPPIARLLEGIVDARAARQSPSSSSSPEQAIADGLTEMRKELAELCHLRICLGGKVVGYSGRIPGIVEEACLTLERGRPVLASTVFGGASRVVVCGLSNFNVPIPQSWSALRFDPGKEAKDIQRAAEQVEVAPLDAAERERLWTSTSIEVCLDLCLRGAVRWWNMVDRQKLA